MTVWSARRTTVRPGRERDYRRIHARIPDAVVAALRASGVVSWRIWIDGCSLFHAIETRAGYQQMMDEIVSLGTVDHEWDDLVASLLESEPTAWDVLDPVWSLDETGRQHPGVAGPRP